MLVPLILALPPPILAEVIPTPGAKMSTHPPKLEKVALVSFLSEAATVMASATPAGETLQAS